MAFSLVVFVFPDLSIIKFLSWHFSLSNRNNGTCYRQCQGRSVLLSPTSSSAIPLSSSLGWRSGTEGRGGLSHCLWVLSVTENLAPCLPRQLCPPVALTLHPDSHTHCKVSTHLTWWHTCTNVNEQLCSSLKNSYLCLSKCLFTFSVLFCRAPLSMCSMAFLVSWVMELYIQITTWLGHFVGPQGLNLSPWRPPQVSIHIFIQ